MVGFRDTIDNSKGYDQRFAGKDPGPYIGVVKFVEMAIHNCANSEIVNFVAQDVSARKTVRLSRHRDFTEQVLINFCQKYEINLQLG